jgi:hypothetical protein
MLEQMPQTERESKLYDEIDALQDKLMALIMRDNKRKESFWIRVFLGAIASLIPTVPTLLFLDFLLGGPLWHPVIQYLVPAFWGAVISQYQID